MEKKSYDIPQLEVYLMWQGNIIKTSGDSFNQVDDGAQEDFFPES